MGKFPSAEVLVIERIRAVIGVSLRNSLRTRDSSSGGMAQRSLLTDGSERPLGDVRAAGPSFSGPDIRLTDLVWPQVYRKATEGGTLFLRWPGGFRPRSDRRESVEIRPGSPRRGLSFGQCLAKNQVPVDRLVGLSQVGFSRRRDKIMPDRTKEKP
jgi:hypothetical protein